MIPDMAGMGDGLGGGMGPGTTGANPGRAPASVYARRHQLAPYRCAKNRLRADETTLRLLNFFAATCKP